MHKSLVTVKGMLVFAAYRRTTERPSSPSELEFSLPSVCSLRVLRTIRKAEYAELMALFFLQGAALGMWFVPLSTVLDAHGLHAIKPFAFAATALAAFVSPLIFGAMADRHASPVIVLRGLSLATAAAMALASTGIKLGWNPWLVLALIQLHALCSSPTFSIASTIVFARLADAQKEFGPIRAMATLGWMSRLLAGQRAGGGHLRAGRIQRRGRCGCWPAAFTFFLPELETPKSAEHLTWHERLGPGRAHPVEEPRPPRRVHHLGPVLHSAGGLLSVCAAAPARSSACCTPARG